MSASVVTSPPPTSSANHALVSAVSVPSLERHVFFRPNNAVRGEALFLEREVGAEVAAAALLAGERAPRDQPRQEMRRFGQATKAGRVAHKPSVLPHGPPQGRRRLVGNSQ